MAEINDLSVTDASNTARFPEGQNPSTVNDGMRALEGIIARAAKDTFDGVLVTGGTSTAFTATPNRSLSTSYYDGLQFSLEFNATCGANPTLNVGGKGAKYLAWSDGTSLTTSDILSGTHAIVKYDVTNERWLVMTSPPDPDLTAIAGLARARGDLIVGGASAWEREAIGTNGQVLGSDGTDVAWADRKTLGTPQATTSGTAFDFTGIPAWAKKITVVFTGVSLSGSDAIIVQIGDSGGIETSGYLGAAGQGTTFANFTTAFGVINSGGAGSIHHGSMTLTLANSSSNTWVASGTVGLSNSTTVYVSGGSKSLSATLTQVRVTRSGTDTFDAGEVNVVYE